MNAKKYKKLLEQQINSLKLYNKILESMKPEEIKRFQKIKIKGDSLTHKYIKSQQKIVVAALKLSDVLNSVNKLLKHDKEVKPILSHLNTLSKYYQAIIAKAGDPYTAGQIIGYKQAILASLDPKLMAKQLELNNRFLDKLKIQLNELNKEFESVKEKINQIQAHSESSTELFSEAKILDVILAPFKKIGNTMRKIALWLLDGWIKLFNAINPLVNGVFKKIEFLEKKYNELIGKVAVKIISKISPTVIDIIRAFGIDPETELALHFGRAITWGVTRLLSFFSLGGFWNSIFASYIALSSIFAKIRKYQQISQNLQVVLAGKELYDNTKQAIDPLFADNNL